MLTVVLLSAALFAQPRDPGAPSNPPAAAAPTRHAVSMNNMQYDPASLKIKVGDTVVWTNKDDRDHTVVASNNSFKSDNIKPNGTFSFQFKSAGTFTYGCTYHPRMKGSIIVEAAK